MSPDTKSPILRVLNDVETLRRLLRLYPQGHPSLAPARERVAASARDLGLAGEAVLGVTNGQIVWGKEEIAVAPAVPCGRLVTLLFQLGVAAIRVTLPAAAQGLVVLAQRLAALREPPGEGDREAFFAQPADLPGIELIPLDLSGVQLVEEESVSSRDSTRFAWRELAARLASRGTFLLGGQIDAGHLSPGVVVDLLAKVPDQASLLDHLFAQLAEAVQPTRGPQRVLLYKEVRAFLSELVSLLDPDRKALAVVVAAKHLPLLGDPQAGIEPLLRGGVLLDAVERMLASRMAIPEVVQRAVYQMAAPPEEAPVALPEEVVARARALLPRLPVSYARQPMPDDRAGERPEPGSAIRTAGATELLAAMGENELHSHFLCVLGEAVTLWPDQPVGDRAAQRLAEELIAAIEIGDLENAARLAALVSATRSRDAREVACTAGVAAAVKALSSLDKSSHPGIVAVIATLGERALPAVLEALAEEENLAVRKRLLEIVARHGEPAIPYLLPLFDDPRWYVVRNAVFLLRRLGYRNMLSELKTLLPDAKSQLAAEILKALVAFEDPGWLAILERELASADEERQLAVVAVAARIRHPQVARLLAERLRVRLGHRVREDALTIALIRALGRLRDAGALPVLRQVVELRQWKYTFSIAGLRREGAVAIAMLEGGEARRVATALAADRDEQLAAAVRAAMQRPEAPVEEGE